jgi:hypothetical protein
MILPLFSKAAEALKGGCSSHSLRIPWGKKEEKKHRSRIASGLLSPKLGIRAHSKNVHNAKDTTRGGATGITEAETDGETSN